MTTVEDRKAAQAHNVRTLLTLIAAREISSVGDDHWVVYDDTRPEGYRVTDQVESLITRGYAKPDGYYDLLITEAGRARLELLNGRVTVTPASTEPTVGGES